MSPRRTRFEAMLFKAESVRFEACAGFRPGEDLLMCGCGWLEDDHAPAIAAAARFDGSVDTAVATVSRVRPIPRRSVRLPERRAS